MRNVYAVGEYIDKIADNSYNEENVTNNKEEMKRLLKNAMNRVLTERQKRCICMYYFDNMRIEDIGKELGLHKSTVSRHITAARKKLALMKLFF